MENIQALQAQIEAMDEQLERQSAELMGIKIALTWLAPFLPLSEQDAAHALQSALDQAESATAQAGTGHDTALACLSAVQGAMAQAGAFWRARKSSQEG